MNSDPTREEFDQYSQEYDELLRDPIRDRFTSEPIFFHIRKRDLIRDFLRRVRQGGKVRSYLDVGCGKGQLLGLLKSDFGEVAGCDVSREMSANLASRIAWRLQQDPDKLPFDDNQFGFVTAVCVYHHVAVEQRAALTSEIFRVLEPGGIFAMIEHNPYNPVTRLIVKRTPVDANAILLSRREATRWMKDAGFKPLHAPYFLYFPQWVYEKLGWLENWLTWVPLGGQYAVFAEAKKPALSTPAENLALCRSEKQPPAGDGGLQVGPVG